MPLHVQSQQARARLLSELVARYYFGFNWRQSCGISSSSLAYWDATELSRAHLVLI